MIEIIKKISELKKKKKKIGLCHGVFDLYHIGHLDYFKNAKEMCDVLVVSVTADNYVNKGPGKPNFDLSKRIEILKSIKIIDYVLPSYNFSAVGIIKKIKPNYYFKGQDYKNLKSDITKNIIAEKKTTERYGGRLIHTTGRLYSSTNLINKNFDFLNKNQKNFINKIKQKYNNENILRIFKKLKEVKILIIGESIIDHYIFCDPLGKSGKDAVLSLKKLNEKFFKGGVVSIGHVIKNFCKKTDLLSVIGNDKLTSKIMLKNKSRNIIYNFLKSKKSTITKTRFVDHVSNFKLLGVYNHDNISLDNNQKVKIKKIFLNLIKKSDLLIIADYGHGLIDKNFAKLISRVKKFKTLNAQLNSANIGHHSINKYSSSNCLVINENELRHEMRDQSTNIQKLLIDFYKNNNFLNIIVTRGKNGAIFYNSKFKIVECPAFETKPVDKIGAGDTLLAFFSALFFVSKCPYISLLIASIVASENVKSFANSLEIDNTILIKSIQNIIK